MNDKDPSFPGSAPGTFPGKAPSSDRGIYPARAHGPPHRVALARVGQSAKADFASSSGEFIRSWGPHPLAWARTLCTYLSLPTGHLPPLTSPRPTGRPPSRIRRGAAQGIGGGLRGLLVHPPHDDAHAAARG